MSAENGVGTRIYYGAVGDTPATQLGGTSDEGAIKDITGMPGSVRGTYNTTKIDQQAAGDPDPDMHFAVSKRRDPGELKVLIIRNDDTIAEADDLDDGVMRAWKILLPSGGTITFNGALISTIDGPVVDDEMTLELTIKANTKRVYTPAA